MPITLNGTTGITTPGLTNTGSETISSGTANGVTYLNGSKVLTSGSALTFDGTNLGVGTASPSAKLYVLNSSGVTLTLEKSGGASIQFINSGGNGYQIDDSSGAMRWLSGGSTERMRLDSSGNLGIGTSSPKEKLDSRGAAVFSGDNATGTNAFGTASGLLLSTSSDNTKARITAVSNGANSISLVLRSLSSGSAVDAVTIDPSGNLGIGTTSPVTLKSATTLQVNGNAKLGNANGAGLLSLGDIASTGANCGIWRGAAGAYGSTGNYLCLGGYDGITFTTGNAEIASQTERMRLDTSGNLGIGVTPDGNNLAKVFQLESGFTMFGFSNTAYLSANAYYNSGWKYKSTAAAAYYEMSGANGHQWSVAASGTAGNAITFTTALTLNANGNLVLQGGNTAANGVGVTFPATQSASSNANTLDDYEEGTWTPTIIGQTTNPTVTYSIRVGYYTKIGRVVSINGIVLLSAYSGGSGVVYISGLPFTVANDSQNFPVGPIGQMSGFTSGFGDVDGQSFVIRGDAGTTNMSILESRTTTTYDWTVGNLSATFLARFSLVYNT